MKDFIMDNLHAIVTTIFSGGTLAYFFERRKRKALTNSVVADAHSKEIDNSGKVVEMYKSALDDLGARYEKKFEEVTQLYERKIKVLEDEIRLHKRTIAQLKKDLVEIRKQLKENQNGDHRK